MSDTVIKIENLWKQYRLGTVGAGTLAHDINRWWHKIRGKEDPYFKISNVNDRTVKGETDYVWALKEINFEVKRGEVLGIIGKNGAGKSTLLKILSQVTAPTKGQVKIKGRIASLLEVGTGFHPELTGRENIFLNGAILGMTKAEIRRKFDEIVDFSGVERYIDTPVKRYSSGMYVRLAFAVAAHLESEILIVDEVLAVGDVEFQKKCMGKMKNVSAGGKTVLFVSHNMTAIRMLCSNGILLANGKLYAYGKIEDVIGKYISANLSYLNSGLVQTDIPMESHLYNSGEGKFISCVIENSNLQTSNELYFREKFIIKLNFLCEKNLDEVGMMAFINNQFGERISTITLKNTFEPFSIKKGLNVFKIDFPFNPLLPGQYSLGFMVFYFKNGSAIDFVESFYPFRVLKQSLIIHEEYPWDTTHGYFLNQTNWTIENKQI
jgi:lipopolysaccharide transport system ATP-binding protein